MLSLSELGDVIDRRLSSDLFRLETHDVLTVPADEGLVRSYLDGAPAPDHPWAEVVRNEVAHGKITRRVLTLTEPLTDYRRMSIEWQYLRNADAGEQCRVVERANDPGVGAQDFWMIEGRSVLLMHYSEEEGRFIGAELIDSLAKVERWRDVATRAWDAGTDLRDWWNDHPQYRRASDSPSPRSIDDPTTERTDHAARTSAAGTSD